MHPSPDWPNSSSSSRKLLRPASYETAEGNRADITGQPQPSLPWRYTQTPTPTPTGPQSQTTSKSHRAQCTESKTDTKSHRPLLGCASALPFLHPINLHLYCQGLDISGPCEGLTISTLFSKTNALSKWLARAPLPHRLTSRPLPRIPVLSPRLSRGGEQSCVRKDPTPRCRNGGRGKDGRTEGRKRVIQSRWWSGRFDGLLSTFNTPSPLGTMDG